MPAPNAAPCELVDEIESLLQKHREELVQKVQWWQSSFGSPAPAENSCPSTKERESRSTNRSSGSRMASSDSLPLSHGRRSTLMPVRQGSMERLDRRGQPKNANKSVEDVRFKSRLCTLLMARHLGLARNCPFCLAGRGATLDHIS